MFPDECGWRGQNLLINLIYPGKITGKQPAMK
jgi:hypothetical protein